MTDHKKKHQKNLGPEVVAFAKAHFNHKVGDGECFALADKALRRVGAKSASDYGKITDDADYVWGDPVDLEHLAPGDILQFRDHDIFIRKDITEDYKKAGKIIKEEKSWEEVHKRRGHHTAIVEQNLGNGKVIILEQHVKPLGPVVQRHTIPIGPPYAVHYTNKVQHKNKVVYITTNETWTGTINAFRPHAAEHPHKLHPPGAHQPHKPHL